MAPRKPRDVQKTVDGVRVFFRKVFTDIKMHGPDVDFKKIMESPVMVASTHRSHIDYFFVGQELIDRGLKGMRFAAGDNLTTLPFLGRTFLELGSFPVKRSGGFERTYVRDLCNQVVEMMKKHEPVLVFPEGGRSYAGNMMEMRYGILGAAVLLQARHPELPVYLVPATASYERIPELEHFKTVLKGKSLRGKKGNILSQIFGNILYFGGDLLAFAKFLNAPRFGVSYGVAHIDYDKPICVRDVIDIAALKDPKSTDEFSSNIKAMKALADHLAKTFVSLYRILPMHVAAYAIMNNKATSQADIAKYAHTIIAQGRTQGCNMQEFTTLSPEQVATIGCRQLAAARGITSAKSGFTIKNPDVLRYYAAAIA